MTGLGGSRMADVTVQELRNRCGAIVDGMAAGERVTITRRGEPVAQLERIRHGLTAAELLDRWQHLPTVSEAMLRADIDTQLIPNPRPPDR